MDDHSDLFLNRKKLAQTLFSLSSRQLARFRELFPTPISDERIETALNLAAGYAPTDPDPKPKSKTVTSPSIIHPKSRKVKKKMQPQ